jgi:hypothetical protein
VRYVLSKRRKKPQRQVMAKPRTTVGDLFASAPRERATLTLRPSERGMLTAEFARWRVWTLVEATSRQAWLLVRRTGKHLTYVLSNAALDTSRQTMTWHNSQRFFIERSNQDAKSVLAWFAFVSRVLWPPVS